MEGRAAVWVYPEEHTAEAALLVEGREGARHERVPNDTTSPRATEPRATAAGRYTALLAVVTLCWGGRPAPVHSTPVETPASQETGSTSAAVAVEIQAAIDRETAAWDDQDAEALVSIFHPDMVWPWPPSPQSHDPVTWVFPQGRFDRDRWLASYEEFFRTYELVHNVRHTVRILVSEERDGAFAVVDVDTLWRRRSDGEPYHWKGRASKGYTLVDGEWLLIFHTGLLDYDGL